MNIPVNVDVYCSDGLCGRSTHLIADPTSKQVTYLVVKEKQAPHTEYLVPIDQMVDSTPDMIKVRCTLAGLATMDPFIHINTIQKDARSMGYPSQQFMYMGGLRMGYVPMGYGVWPYGPNERFTVTVKSEAIPKGEVALTRGSQINASDGKVGRLDGFLADPTSGQVTYLVLRKGHLWGQKDVLIPVAQVDYMKDDTVYLKLDKQSIGVLPTTLAEA
jgi:hypothetical protein